MSAARLYTKSRRYLVERGDTGLGRDAYGLPRRRRLGDRRAYRRADGPDPTGPDGGTDDEYGHLLRRPGEMPPQQEYYQPGQSRMRPPPGRFGPPPGNPPDGYPPNGMPGNGGPMNGGVANGGSPTGGPVPGRQYRLPNGRRVPPRAERPYRPQAPGAAGMRATWDQPYQGPPSNQDPLGWGRPYRPQAPAGPPPPPRADGGPQGYGHPQGAPGAGGTPGMPGATGMPGPGGMQGAAGGSGFAGGMSGAPGGGGFAGGMPGPGGMPGTAGSGGFAGGMPGAPGGGGFAGGPAGSRGDGLYGRDGRDSTGRDGTGRDGTGRDGTGRDSNGRERRQGWGRLGAPGAHGVQAGSAEQVIRQRENGVPDERPPSAVPSAVSIAPDGLDSFARDLRALRSKAELDYTEMAETSHYTMKTLVSAAGGLRLPTLPVAVAYVRACGGNVAEWEERWQKLAARVTADAAKKRRGEGDERLALPEPAEQQIVPEPPAPPSTQVAPAESGEVYVITSAKPRQPGW